MAALQFVVVTFGICNQKKLETKSRSVVEYHGIPAIFKGSCGPFSFLWRSCRVCENAVRPRLLGSLTIGLVNPCYKS